MLEERKKLVLSLQIYSITPIPKNASIFRPTGRSSFKSLTSRAYIKIIEEIFNRCNTQFLGILI